jgi:predicted DNA-binding protein
VSPRTGRPTDNPKTHETRIRMSDGDIQKLDYCCQVLGLTKAEVIRQGIERMFEEAQKNAPK